MKDVFCLSELAVELCDSDATLRHMRFAHWLREALPMFTVSYLSHSFGRDCAWRSVECVVYLRALRILYIFLPLACGHFLRSTGLGLKWEGPFLRPRLYRCVNLI